MPQPKNNRGRRGPEPWNNQKHESIDTAMETLQEPGTSVQGTVLLASVPIEGDSGRRSLSKRVGDTAAAKGNKKFLPGPDASTVLLEEYFATSKKLSADANVISATTAFTGTSPRAGEQTGS